MEEILIDDTDDNCVTKPTPAGLANKSSADAAGSGSEPPRVMSMLYVQPEKINQTNNNDTTPKSDEVQHIGVIKDKIDKLKKILLKHAVSDKQVNVVNTTTIQGKKHILLKKSDDGAQIMPLGNSTNSTNQVEIKPGIILSTNIKPKLKESSIPTVLLDSLQLAKPKPVINPVITTVNQTITHLLPKNLQDKSAKPMTKFILPVPVSPQQQSGLSFTKQNQSYKILNISPNYKFTNGIDGKSTVTVLKESKSPNSVSNPPPLQPLKKMSLLSSVTKSGNSPDSIKITENPDSAVITPIPNNDDTNNSEKSKKPTSNILRGSTEKRPKKQSFSSLLDSNVVEGSRYSIEKVESNYEKEKKIDKEDDDDITLIKVVKTEEKNIKKYKLSDELSMEIVKEPGNLEIEVIKQVNGKMTDEETKDRSISQNDSSFDASKVLDWKDGVGSLPGSTLKFCMNEFGLMEVVDDEDEKDPKDKIIWYTQKENSNRTQNSSKSCSPALIIEKREGKKSRTSSTEIVEDSKKDLDGIIWYEQKENVTRNSSKSSSPVIIEKKEEKKPRSPSADTFYCCEGCGCHGLASEFESPTSCSPSCTEYINMMNQKKLRKEKDQSNKDLKKKNRRKFLEQLKCQSKDRDKSKDSKSNDSDEKSKDSEDKFDVKSSQEKTKSESDEDSKDTNLDVDEESQGESESKQYPWLTGKNGFSWSKYLEHTKAKAAPVKLFKDAFPYSKNNFKVGMKLEGIDPNHPSHYCVLTVSEVVGYRLRLHFDGFAENFDFWANADSMDIFPCGWAEKNGHKLHPPKGYVQNNFSWNAYLKICKATAAPKPLFSNKNSMLPTGFRVGMKLEAVDRKHSSLVCVASVADVMDSRILVHFDSWDDIYDYWADVSSPYIHPIGWCHHNGRSLTPPNYPKDTKSLADLKDNESVSDYKDPKSFSWDVYLKGTSSVAAPSRAFKQRPPCGFKRGMKLEAVDKRLPQLIRVATVEDVKDHLLKIKFDGWPDNHAFWVEDDSTDIHPMGWCKKTGHPLEPPLTQENLTDRPECGTFGCRGIGHVKGPKYSTHNSASGCPYSPQNLNKIKAIVDRYNVKQEDSHFEEDSVIDKTKLEKVEKIKMERSDRRLSSFEDKPIKIENIKQEEDDSDKNDKQESSNRVVGSKWKIESDGHSEEEEPVRRGRKRKRKENMKNLNLSILDSTNEISSGRGSYATNMPDKQLRMELYHSVYNPGYNPLPDAPHIWAKHSSALNRIVSKQSTNPRRWSNEEVIKFIQSVPNCKEIGSIFRKHSVDGESFLMLNQEDLVTLLGLKLGPAIKLYNSIVLLRKKAS